jgi:aminopeptidase
MDKRWLQLGHMLVNQAVEVKQGERVMISMSEIGSFDLARSVYEAVIKAGGFPQIQFLSEKLKHSLLKYGNEEQISWVPEIESMGMDWADVYIGLRGAYNFGELSDVSTERAVKQQAAMGIISSKRWEKTRWTLIRIPTEEFAVQAKVNFDTILDMFFNSCFVDFESERVKWTKFSQRLEKGKRVRIIANKTDLSFSVEGMKWVPALGGSNVPDGEIATAPRIETIDGYIYFENPGVLGGRLIPDITLRWEKGKFVSATSSSNQEFLTSIVNTPGANTIGEFALGINREMNRFCNDILFDEKIYGTIHIALGRAYPMCNGTNQSSIHWDIVKDTRLPGSKVYLDEEIILEEGEYIL